MVAYLLLLIVPLGTWLSVSSGHMSIRKKSFTNKKKNSCVLLAFFLVLLILLMLRSSNVGIDLQVYLPRFQEIADTTWNKIFTLSDNEPGYIILNKLISVIGTNNQFFLSLIALITILPLCIFYCKESENALLTVSIFLILPNFIMLFSGLRQAIAIGLGVPAYYLARRKKLFWFLCIVVLAMQFHQSAFVLLLLYPLLHVKITKKWLWFVVPCMAAILLFHVEIFNFLLQFLGGRYQDRYGEIESTGAYTMIILFVLFAIYAFIVPSSQKLDGATIGLRNILLLTVCIQFFAPLNSIAMRINYYFLIFLPILIPKIANRCNESDVKIISFSKAVMIVFFLVYFLIETATGVDTLQIYPYIPFWAE